jgi:small subunit ribosomal protein S11e
VQNEKAFQKQLGVNGGWKKPARRTPGKGGQRYYKNVGLGFKTPKEAIEGGFLCRSAEEGFRACAY